MASQGTQGETAHSKAEAEELAKDSLRLANGPADDLVAGTMASVGPRGWRDVAIAIIAGSPSPLALMLPYGALAPWFAFVVFFVVCFVTTTVLAARLRRPVYLSVTQDELISYLVPKMSQQPTTADVLFRASPRAIRINGRKDKKSQNWTIRFGTRGPGAKGLPQQRRIRAWLELCLAIQHPLTVDRSWYRELGEVMTALQASGAKVKPALLDITAALTAAEAPERD